MKYLFLLLFSFSAIADTVYLNAPIVVNGSMAADVASTPVEITTFNGYSVTAKVTGGSSPDGMIAIQVSNDDAASPTSWIELAGSANTIDGDDTVVWNVADAYYKWFRIFYDRTSGSGTLNVNYNVKRVK